MNRQIRINKNSLDGKSENEKREIERHGECAQLLSAIADANRLMIVSALMKGPASVSEVAESIGCDMAKTSHHLGVLKTAGLVNSERDARLQIYSLRPGFATRGNGKSPDMLNFGCCTVAIPK